MGKEYETQVLDINPKEIAEKLRKLGAKEEEEYLQKRWVFDIEQTEKNETWIRLREAKGKTTITYKNKTGTGISDTEEIEVDEELEEDSEFLTAGQVAEYVSQEFDEDEIVHWGVWCKSDVESDLGVEITQEQWLKFLRLFVNDDVLNEVRAAAWMEAVEVIRQEVEG